MSEHELPEDLDQWPQDPYELLGVGHGDEPIVVKRAYTRLIRRFKPEQFPAHFMRLRQAYELIRDAGNQGIAIPIVPSMSESFGSATANAPIAEQPESASDNLRQLLSNHDELWKLVSSGQLESALRFIDTHAWSETETSSVLLTKYWVTKLLKPGPAESDAGRVLVENLHRYRRLPKVLGLARHELKGNSTLIKSMDFERCVEGMLDVDDLSDLLRLRWDIALCHGMFDLIADDWRMLAARYLDYERLHIPVAIMVVHYLAWSPDQQHRTSVDELIADLEQRLGRDDKNVYTLDRIEQLVALRASLERFQETHSAWQPLVDWAPAMWNQVADGYVAAASDWLVHAMDECSEALLFLDDVRPFAEVCLFYIQHFEGLLQEISRQAEPGDDRVHQAWSLSRRTATPAYYETEQIEEFLSSYDDVPYERFRVRVVKFAVEHNIALQKITGYIENSPSIYARYMRIELFKRLQPDDSLLLIAQLLHRCHA